jgi:DNA modification methylase
MENLLSKHGYLSKRVLKDTEVEWVKIDDRKNRCLDIRKINPESLKDRGRKEFHDILELSMSIKELGLLMPINVIEKTLPDGTISYDLVAGERRYRAFLLTGERYIPFIIGQEDPVWKKEAELYENLHRSALSLPEEAALLHQIHTLKVAQHGVAVKGKANPDAWSLEKTAALTGRGLGVVSDKIQLHKHYTKNPNLIKELGNLPLSAQLKEIKRREDRQAFTDKAAAGTISVSGSVKLCSCLDLARELKQSNTLAHCLIMDPPFGNSEIEQQSGGTSRSNMVYTSIIKQSDNMDSSSMRTLLNELIPLAAQVLIPGAHFYIFYAFEHYDFLSDLLLANDFLPEPKPLIWDKDTTVTPAMGYNYQSSYEPIIFGHFKERSRRLSGTGLRDILKHKPVGKNDRMHPFQKPKMLLADLIGHSTIEGELVLDFFAGSGSTIKTALSMNRNALGSEIDQANWTSAQLNLGKAPVLEVVK